MRRIFLGLALAAAAANVAFAVWWPAGLWSLVLLGPVILLGLQDIRQKSQAIRRNFPILGRFRYLFEAIRPEINQYFVESNTDGRPFSREERSVVYQRAKKVLDTLPFGTQRNVYETGFEWVNHSILPTHVDPKTLRVTVGGPDCRKPYAASLLNISAMSFGSLSPNAILALNGAARDGGFAHNTGEGGVSPYHEEPGGDLVWQVGTGYFGCRAPDGGFCEKTFADRAASPQIKMIEIKLSQGAKPGHGGILPARKVTPLIAKIRGVPLGQDVISPPAHRTFTTPTGMMEWIARVRELAGGKPVGFKLCLGKRREFVALCMAMQKTGIAPDFITVDGKEGGTGAAPLEFTNRVGFPLVEGFVFVRNCLVGFGLRDRIRLIAAGRMIGGFDIVKLLGLGADMVNSARAMMMALGCIQALRCNSNTCPTGVATQNPELMAGLVVPDKRRRVANFHGETLASAAHLLGAMGLERSADVRPWHLMRRVGPTEVRHYGEIFEFIPAGSLLAPPYPESFARVMDSAVPDSFRHRVEVEIGSGSAP